MLLGGDDYQNLRLHVERTGVQTDNFPFLMLARNPSRMREITWFRVQGLGVRV